MKHTKESIGALLEKNDAAVRKAIRTVKEQCGFLSCDQRFGESLLRQLNEGSLLSKQQLFCARQMLSRYLAVLARVANEKQQQPVAVAVAEPTVDW